jgi:hypothetical protein
MAPDTTNERKDKRVGSLLRQLASEKAPGGTHKGTHPILFGTVFERSSRG